MVCVLLCSCCLSTVPELHYENAYYWSGEEHESNAGWAWCQNFTSGYEGSNIIEGELRARAVRRFIPE